MSFLFAKSKTVIPDFTGLQVQTSVNTVPIAIIYGSPRVQMNIIYANGFTAQAIKSGGGKGLLSGGKGATQGYKYFATFIGAIGEGTLNGILAIFDDQQVYTLGTAPSGKVFNFFNGGGDNSAPWTYVSTLWPDDAFAYKDTAYVGCDNFPLDSSATIPQLNFLAYGKFAATSPLNLYTAPDGESFLLDADPGQSMYDFLTNSTYGVGFPTAFVDYYSLIGSASSTNPAIGDTAVQTYCQAVGLAWSTVINNAEPASSILDRWCKNLVVAPVWTGNILRFIPYYDTYIGTNPGWYSGGGLPKLYYNPASVLQPIFDLDDRDFQQAAQGEDPITVSRIDNADAKNVVRVDFKDRNNLFNDNVAEAKDENSVELYGPRVDRMGNADEFNLDTYAAQSAQQKLQRNMSIRNTYEFKLGWQYCVLDPMDVVTVTDVALGLDRFPVRIVSIEEDEKGILSIVAEEFPIGAGSVTAYVRQDNTPPTDNLINVTVGSVNVPFIFEPTQQALVAQGFSNPTVIVGASGGPSGVFDPFWGGAYVYLSTDNITYALQGTLTGPSRQGTLTGTLNAYAGVNPDTGNTLSITLAESDGELETVTGAQAAAGLTLCAVQDTDGTVELLTYTTATLTGPNTYDLTGLYRGLYGTIPCSHPSSSLFLRVDAAIFETPLQTAFIGETIYVKLVSFNIYGSAPQDLSACTAYTYVPTGAGISPNGNLIYLTLQMGGDVDLNAFTPTTDLDLNLGGFGACAPILFDIDLGTL